MENIADKPWDDNLKQLVRANPDAFVSWLIGQAQFLKELPVKLRTWKLELDALLQVNVNEQEMLLHIEFQAYKDPTMAERLLRYNVLVRSEYHLPVLSWVIYLFKGSKAPLSPLRWMVPTGQDILRFHFESIELSELTTEDLLKLKQPGLLPLLPLTRNGANREVANTMFEALVTARQDGLMAIGGTLASLIFSKENPAELDWLNRRLKEMHGILRESPFYQEILREGREEGLEEGIEKGIEKGREEGIRQANQQLLQNMRETLLRVVQARFPKLARLAKGQASIIDEVALLQDLIVKVSIAQDSKEARNYLLDEVENAED